MLIAHSSRIVLHHRCDMALSMCIDTLGPCSFSIALDHNDDTAITRSVDTLYLHS